ncbi:PstS family phosphate ABC transporter substrate-binding protein [Phormidium tenue FACHB-886]|nr:PstS family phosphate ABC transporter substrate-binding protein [Phormidium tenue FACHB-886]
MAQKNDAPALIVSLLVTLGLIGGGLWWLRQSDFSIGNFGGGASPSVSPPVTNSSPAAATQSAGQTAQTFAEVENVPSGLFNYGGSTSWAPIRGQVDPQIQSAWSGFRLRYTQPATGSPGSSMGIRMLLNNQLSIAQSSRSLKPEEYQAAQTRGFTLKEIPVALEGIAVAVHPGLNLPGLTIDQLKGIYTGQITNWNQVGGADVPIVPYSRRPADGGTVEFFVENVLGGAGFDATVQYINTTTEALQAVATNPGGIYYASAPEVVGQCGVQPLALGRQSTELVAPYQEPSVPAAECSAQNRTQLDADALQSGQYPLTRRLFVIVKQNGQADQQAGEAYANLLLSEQGQSLLSKAGFIRIR